MAIVTTGLWNLIVILVIGIAVGLVFNRYGRSWLGRKTIGVDRGGRRRLCSRRGRGLVHRISSGNYSWPAFDALNVVFGIYRRCCGYCSAVAKKMDRSTKTEDVLAAI